MASDPQSPMRPMRPMTPVTTRRSRPQIYYANRSWFVKPGVYFWTGKRHLRVLPLPRRPR